MSNLKSITITDEELKRLRFIGSGGFGSVFADENDECTIKKYHDKVKSLDYYANNPCLRIKRKKFKRLNRLAGKIKYTDVGLELVYNGFRFIGVKKKYYDGKTLDKLENISFDEKKIITAKLIRNAKELTSHRIYNLDYKTNNVLLTKQGEVKIIDLDDIYTRVTFFPNYFHKRKSLRKLKETIIYYFYRNQYEFSSDVAKMVTSSPENNPTLQKDMSYEELHDFVNEIQLEDNILIIKTSCINKINKQALKKYVDDNNLFVVLALDKNTLHYNEKAVVAIKTMNDCGIDVYDIFKYSDDYSQDVENYMKSHGCINVHTYEEDFKILKK